ncbi:MAG: hypothetical protein Q8R28_09525 [Dehalococcoidia bacterium]|nr:hypothetical protein [Dehalococcoidia bacterium]
MQLTRALAALAATAVLASCASTAKIPTGRVAEYRMTPPAQGTQTKSNVTIEVEVLKRSEAYNHPELFAFDIKQFPESHYNFTTMGMFPEEAQGRQWCYTFGFGVNFLTAMHVKITNNTPHILRMKDSRIYFVVDGEDPMAAVTNLGNASLVNVPTQKGDDRYLPKSFVDGDGSLVHQLTLFEAEWDRTRKKGLIKTTYPLGFASLVVQQNRKEYQLINDLSAEILPDFSREGILLFPAIVSWDEARLMFYDITTKTDAAGNPVEKASFTFPLAKEVVDMWYDKAEKLWKRGLPPVAATASTSGSSGERRGPR